MRFSGFVEPSSRLGPGDHICLAYTGPADLRRRAVAFLAEGVAQGQRVVYIGSGSEKQLRSELSGLPEVESLLETGAAQVFSGTSVYATSPVLDGASPVVDAEAQVGWYSRQLKWRLPPVSAG